MLRTQLQTRLRDSFLKCTYATSPTVTGTPSLLVKVREDMKSAMRAKDRARYINPRNVYCHREAYIIFICRLDVLRGLLSDTTNAAKASNPVTTDAHMIQIIRKRAKSSEGAAKEAEDAKRDDLRDKELKQIAVLESYIKDSNSMSEDDVKGAVQETIGNMRTEGRKTDKGSVMKALVGPGGLLDGQLVNKKEVASIVSGML